MSQRTSFMGSATSHKMLSGIKKRGLTLAEQVELANKKTTQIRAQREKAPLTLAQQVELANKKAIQIRAEREKALKDAEERRMRINRR